MIETIRKHSKWLLWIIAGATIFSLVFYMGFTQNRSGGGVYGVNTNEVSGKIYGQPVTQEQYNQSTRDVALYFLFNYGTWPRNNPNITKDMLLQRTYINMLMLQKAEQLGVHVNDDQVKQAAADVLSSPALLRALNVSGQRSVPVSDFVDRVLAPEGLSAVDFENYVRDQLTIEQLQQFYGLSGELITPQEITNEYVRQNQEFSAQIVFFSATNFMSQAVVTPEDVGQFYTNYMAEYRMPDRVQVSYVVFNVTNFLPAAEERLAKTNLDFQVANLYNKYGTQVAPEAKTPEEAKAVIRKLVIRQAALEDAAKQAGDFAQAVFNVSTSNNKPASSQDLLTVARQKGLTVQTPAPFSAQYGPEEFTAPPAFTQAAFELTSDTPISEPVSGPDGVYVIALEKNIPNEIPPLDQIRAQVTHDLKMREAAFLAIRSGTNFARQVASEMAIGKSFAAASTAVGAQPEMLPPVSLSTEDVPELDGRATMNQLRQALIVTPVGMPSSFMETEDGGFVLYVASRLPLDDSKMTADLPEFTTRLRQQREQAAFNEWLQREGNRELRSTPLGRQMGAR